MSDLHEGLTFAGCRLEKIAARGGMGVVWKATQLALARPVALKAIAPDLAESAEFRERFQRESQLAASIDHANVIPVYEAGELDGTLYLIMRWVDGTDLRDLLRRSGKLAPGHALRLLIPVAGALAAAHRRGLIHRDVKPANVLIARDDDHVYLTDFGIARTANSDSAMTKTGALVGTLDYMAPERFEGGRGDVASDIYAFGCMLYETVTGQIPFPRPSEVSKMFAHINDPPPSTRELSFDVPECLDAIIAKAMAKRPEDRFGSATELLAALTSAMAEVDTVEELPTQRRSASQGAPIGMIKAAGTRAPAQMTSVSPPAATRRRGRYALLAVAAALLVVGGVVAAIASGGGNSGGRAASTHDAGLPDREVTSVSGGLKIGMSVILPATPAALSSNFRVGVGMVIPSNGQLVFLRLGRPPLEKFSLGGHPNTIVGGRYGAWVGCSGAGPLVRIQTAAEIEARATGDPRCPVLTATNPVEDSVWATYADHQLIHYGVGGDRITRAKLPGSASGMAVGEGWVWVADRNLVRIDPADGASRTFYSGPGAVSVALDRGVWTAHSTGFVTRFNPRADKLDLNTNIAVAQSLSRIAAVEGARSVWAIGKEGLYRIDSSSLSVTGAVGFRSTPIALTAEPGLVFVATADGHLVRIDG